VKSPIRFAQGKLRERQRRNADCPFGFAQGRLRLGRGFRRCRKSTAVRSKLLTNGCLRSQVAPGVEYRRNGRFRDWRFRDTEAGGWQARQPAPRSNGEIPTVVESIPDSPPSE